jgi:hypothetical protein
MRIIKLIVINLIGLVVLLLGSCMGLQYAYRDRAAEQNFRVTVEDDRGKQLATAVWRMHSSRTSIQGPSEGVDGEAFVIEHPRLGKLYVLGGMNSEVLKNAYRKLGILPSSYEECSVFPLDCPSALPQMKKTRVLIEQRRTPLVVRFRNQHIPASIQLVDTRSASGNDIELRFFVQATNDPVTCGIVKHLPWLETHENSEPFVAGSAWKKLTGGYGWSVQKEGFGPSPNPGPTNSALDWVSKSKFGLCRNKK